MSDLSAKVTDLGTGINGDINMVVSFGDGSTVDSSDASQYQNKSSLEHCKM